MEDYLLLTVMMDDVGTWSMELDRKWDCSQALMLHQKFGALEFLILASCRQLQSSGSMKQVRHFLHVSDMR